MGDSLYGLDAQNKPVPQVVKGVTSSMQPCVRIDFAGGSLTCSESHLVRTGNRPVAQAKTLNVHGEHLIGKHGEVLPIHAIHPAGVQQVYCCALAGQQVFVAANVLSIAK